MSWLALSFALLHADPREPTSSQWPNFLQTGRVVDGAWHLGIRPALAIDPETTDGSLDWAVGATVQVTADVL